MPPNDYSSSGLKSLNAISTEMIDRPMGALAGVTENQFRGARRDMTAREGKRFARGSILAALKAIAARVTLGKPARRAPLRAASPAKFGVSLKPSIAAVNGAAIAGGMRDRDTL